jgi:enolase
VDVQDFLVIPKSANTFAEAMEWVGEIYLAAQGLMKQKGAVFGVADEGGLWPAFAANEEAIATLTTAIEAAGFRAGEVGIALDIAASNFAKGHEYVLALEGKHLTTADLTARLSDWCRSYPIVSLEDPLGEDDDAGFTAITRALGESVQIVGDDYLTTNAQRIRRAAELGACNAALLKANQCGTVTELIEASAAAKSAGWNTIMSGRSGESEDVTLSHLAVGLLSDQIKVGSIARSERAAKWNETIRIEENIAPGSYWQFAVARPTGPSKP